MSQGLPEGCSSGQSTQTPCSLRKGLPSASLAIPTRRSVAADPCLADERISPSGRGLLSRRATLGRRGLEELLAALAAAPLGPGLHDRRGPDALPGGGPGVDEGLDPHGPTANGALL